MKKILFILAFVYAAFSYGQGGPKVDAVKYKGDVTTAVRNLIDVPVGETWLVWDVTLSAFYYASSDDVWNKLIVDGAQTTELFQVATQALNKIEVGIDGPTGGTDYIRISGGETSGQAPLIYITDNRLAVSNYDNTDIDAVGATSLITKAYGDANYGSGGVTDGDKGEIVVSGGVWSIDTNAVSLGNMADNSITQAEIIDDTVIEADLAISNTPTLGYALTSNGSTGFTWTNPSSFIGVGSILEDKLNIDNAPTNNYILAYNQPSLNFKWVDPATLGGSSSLPVDDTTSLVQDPVDGTKEMRIDVGAVSTATTRTLTMPDADVDLGNLGAANLDLTANYTWSGTHTFTTQAVFGVSGIRINNATNDYWTQGTVVGQSPGFVFQSYDEAVFNTQYALNFSGSPVNTYDLTPKSYVDGLDHTDDQTASDVNITDANDWFSGTDVEAAIEEIGSDLATLIDSDTTGLGNAAYKPISKLIVHDYSVSPTPPTLGTNEYALQINGPSEEKSFVIKWGAVGADIATGTGLEFIAVHDAITITRVEAYLDTAPTGSVATFDINEDGVSILSTKLTIDAGENWSDTALTAAVISDTAIDALSKLSIDVDGVGSTVAGADPQITIYYTIDP